MIKTIAIIFTLSPALYAQTPAPASTDTAKPVLSSAATLTVNDVFDSGLRNPFAEVKTGGATKISPEDAKKGPVKLENLKLAGIMVFQSGRKALITDTATGMTYTLSGEKLFDAKKKTVPHITGMIDGERVTLFGPNKTVKRLKLPDGKKASK